MDLRHTGSNKILEVQSESVNIVIKSKNPHPNLTNESILDQKSLVKVSGLGIQGVKIFGVEKIENNGLEGRALFYELKTGPLFFEQTDYEIIIQSTNGKTVSLWHENYTIRDKIGPVIDGKNDLISGIINFGNSAGFSDFEIFVDGNKVLVIRIEVYPSKISYKEDYQAMLADISNEIYGAVLDFMRNTYQEFSIGNSQTSIPALFFEIVRRLYQKFINAANRIIASPHHKLNVEHPVVLAHKVRKIDAKTIKWLNNHPEQVVKGDSCFMAAKAPTVQKTITYNTTENQFVKFILKSIVDKLKDFKIRYEKSTQHTEVEVLNTVDTMVKNISRLRNTSFLKDVDDYKAAQSMSLVFEMAPGYRELYKYYLMMLRGLSINGDVFRMSLKDTAQLYEYWCFIKLVTIMKKNYRLASSDIIKVDNSGVTVTLVKGRKSEVVFINPRTGERIVLSYNPGEQNTQTVNQKPDNVLTLQKKGASVEYKYVFDAKYRIENNPSDPFYPDNDYGPKVSDINTMHRYRDSIVYENTNPSRFMFEKTMFGAYVLFPYNDPDDNYKNHRFYKSIETVNIGGLPFLPGTTELVENFLAELVADSEESAFERASLPRGIEEKLAKVDWTKKDVMVGTVRSEEQFKYNVDNKCYYAPKKYIDDNDLPIRYIALHEQGVSSTDGIIRYGEVLTTSLKKRGDIQVPMNRNNADEVYYFFRIREWINLDKPIEIKDSHKGKPRFTNLFLLENCSESYQLFNINSDEQYRLMTELQKAYGKAEASVDDNEYAVYKINDTHTIAQENGYFVIMTMDGDIVEKISISDFEKHPRNIFNKIKRTIGGSV